MAEKYGVENVKKILVAAVDGAMVIDKLVSKEGLFSVFQFSSDFLALGSLNADQLKLEVGEISPEERVALETILKAKLVLHDQALEAKIEKGVDLVEEAIGLAQEASDLITKVKALLQP